MPAIPRFTLVEIFTTLNDKPGVRAWAPDAYEQPGLSKGHKIHGVTMTASVEGDDVTAMTFGYLRAVTEQNGETWTVGDSLWAKADGSITNSRPAAPLPQVFVGRIFKDEGTGGPFSVAVNIKVFPSLGELSGVKMEDPEQADVFIYNSTTHVWEPRRLTGSDIVNVPSGGIAATDIQGAIDELEAEKIGRRWLWMMGD